MDPTATRSDRPSSSTEQSRHPWSVSLAPLSDLLENKGWLHGVSGASHIVQDQGLGSGAPLKSFWDRSSIKGKVCARQILDGTDSRNPLAGSTNLRLPILPEPGRPATIYTIGSGGHLGDTICGLPIAWPDLTRDVNLRGICRRSLYHDPSSQARCCVGPRLERALSATELIRSSACAKCEGGPVEGLQTQCTVSCSASSTHGRLSLPLGRGRNAVACLSIKETSMQCIAGTFVH